MSNLKLITTEKFGDVDCNFYRNMNDNVLLTRKQISNALQYVDETAISKIHKKHKNRIDSFSVVAKLASTDGKDYETTLYSERGVMEICRWSNKPKANEFMDWCFDIVEKYRSGNLSHMQVDMSPITNVLTTLTQSITTLTMSITSMQQDIYELKQSQRNRYLLERSYPSTWYKKMAPKYKMLQQYFDCSRSELYSSIYKELEDTYDIDINQIHEDFCYENRLLKDECYVMDAIEHNTSLRNALTSLIDSSLIKYVLQTEYEIKNFKRKTLFDNETIII